MRSSGSVITVFALALLALGVRTSFAQQVRVELTDSNYFEHDDYSATLKWLTEYQNPEHLPDFEQIRYNGIQQLRAMPNPSITRTGRMAAMMANQTASWQPTGVSQTGAVSGRAAAMDIDPS